ncbi:phosphatase PAP2 family protein [Chitinophaga sedimenti]|uniref:phosphatase PAP2 family protein n=1 Tax=Chitinophaga sedimenti TaxID=2033606 RepID=UPI002002CD74|nr:phosphatase PAP2 family protein [Chitinophaga sedimenti]MCK7553637.1 phosphatase PAP2 family protein [Chitinophaga sedimenti]
MSGRSITVLILCIVAGTQAARCQTITTELLLPDSLTHPTIHWKMQQAPERPFSRRAFLVPATMVVFGAVAASSKEGLRNIDYNIKYEIHDEHLPVRTKIDNILQFTPAASTFLLGIAGVKGKNNFRDRAMIYGMSMMIMNATVFTTKRLTQQHRPDGSNFSSFPSGHTANAFAGAEFMRREYADVSPLYGIAGYAVAATTGYLRIRNNKHWFSDVVAGAGVGILSTDLAYYLYPRIKDKIFKNDKPTTSTLIMPTYSSGSFGLALSRTF